MVECQVHFALPFQFVFTLGETGREGSRRRREAGGLSADDRMVKTELPVAGNY